jgi:hypothetical protein
VTGKERLWTWLMVGFAMALAAGCRPKGEYFAADPGRTVPSPIDLLLPRSIEIHPWTETTTFDDGEGGIHARVVARDAYGDPTKAFGRFRFELYEFRPQSQNKLGARLADWELDLSQAEQNLRHWDQHTRGYEFRLAWTQRLPTGRRLVLVGLFDSEFTTRLTTEKEIVAGE